MIAAGEIGFRKGGVDFAVADLVKQNSWATLAPTQPWDQVVVALRYAFGDRAQAKGADGVFHNAEFAR